MAQRPPPLWQPVRQLPFVAALIDDLSQAAEKQHQTLRNGGDGTRDLDEYALRQIIDVFSREREDLPVFDEQLQRWLALDITEAQEDEIERLRTRLDRLRNVVPSILTLAEDLKSKLIKDLSQRHRTYYTY
jgi:hypothetical protein